MYKIHRLAAILCLFMLSAGVLYAQSPRELRMGVWVSGTLRAGGEEWFSVRPAEAGLITVETSGDIDTYLEVHDESRNLIAEDDDGGDDYNARLEIFVDPGRTYLFKLSCYDEDESGPYRIMASFEPIPPDTERNTEVSRALPLQPGQSLPVFIRASSESRWYRCSLPGPDFTFTAYTRGNLDTILVFHDAQGKELVEDDDSGSGSNARITIPGGSGNIYIEVKTYDGRQGRSDLYTETREAGKPDQFEPDDTLAAAKYIEAGEMQERTFTDANDIDWVRLYITQSRVYEIRCAAADGSLDTYLELYDSNENLIEEDDDSGDKLDALIRIRLYPGDYYIKMYTLDSDPLEDNRYTLSVVASRQE